MAKEKTRTAKSFDEVMVSLIGDITTLDIISGNKDREIYSGYVFTPIIDGREDANARQWCVVQNDSSMEAFFIAIYHVIYTAVTQADEEKYDEALKQLEILRRMITPENIIKARKNFEKK